MKAYVIQNKQLGIENVQLSDVEKPAIADNEVLIRTSYVGLNPVDYKLAEYGNDAWTMPHTLGLDVAGTIALVGANVTAFDVGDRVAGHGDLRKNGSFAEYVAFPAYALAHIPSEVSEQTAAGLLCNAMTAYQAIHQKANLSKKRTILIHGGSGGVGLIAIQLAKRAGLTVYTTCSTGKIPFVKQLQPDAIIDYKSDDVTGRIRKLTAEQGVDMIVNTVGADEATIDLNERLAYNGALIALVGAPKIGDHNRLFDHGHTISLVNLGGAHQSGNAQQKADLSAIATELLDMAAQGILDPMISEVVPFDRLPAGLSNLKAGRTTGKVVVKISS
ncbi:MAG: zinc-binding dehydrogenase [Coriobacteriales bacterium]|jgi:NADPH:quinone reductase-like Zn-dependent oxidoreductase|nr:zinc-binding dehydrogenase [Coriobacteriales bacterium]